MGRKEIKMIYDISYAQRGLQLKDLPNKEAIILRLGIKDHIDTEFENHIKQIGASGTFFGLYWFVHSADAEGALKEASVIMKILQEQKKKWGFFNNLFQLPLFLDYEAWLDGNGKVYYDDNIKPANFSDTATVFKYYLEAETNLGLYLNTGLLNQYLPSPSVSTEARSMCKENLWWADWTSNTSCPAGNYYIRQTGKGNYNGTYVDENVKGNGFKLYVPNTEKEWKDFKQVYLDETYRIIIQKKG